MSNNTNKTYEEIMAEIKKDNYDYYKEIAKRKNDEDSERIDAILEMSRFNETLETKNEVKIENNICIYSLLYNSAIDMGHLDNNSQMAFDKIKFKIAEGANVKNQVNGKTLELMNYENLPLHGRVWFENEQSIETLIIKNVGVKGKFNVSRVVISGITYLDLNLDINNNKDCTYLIIEPNKRNIRGTINMSESFYNHLTSYCRDYLSYVMNWCAINLWVNNIPYHKYAHDETYNRKNKDCKSFDSESIYKELESTMNATQKEK
ncbi:MAG: hypothetical protein IJ593_10285 [Lachnospiraceae bacterium]|nr:hypothetical protein [Lachnospiraceae bacterium]